MPVQIKVQPDVQHKPVPKVGTFEVDWEITQKPRLLERLIAEKTEAFVRAMELRGMTLYGKTKPQVVTHPDGEPMAFYSIDWIGKPEVAPDGGDMPKIRAESLEDCKGRVEFRIVAMFWTPEATMERLVSRDSILQGEREAKNPAQFGYGRTGVVRG
jgi:hypothetical protein